MGVIGSSKKKKKKNLPIGVVRVNSTFNNTIVTVTCPNGDTYASSSAGANGFKGARKSTPYAGQVAASKALEKAVEYGLKTVSIVLRGPGAGREAVAREVANTKYNLTITSVADDTPVPHNGTRPPKRRRV